MAPDQVQDVRNIEIENITKHNKKVVTWCLIITPIVLVIVGVLMDFRYVFIVVFSGIIIAAIIANVLKKPVPKRLE